MRLTFFVFGSLLVWLAGFLTIAGLLIAASIKNDSLADQILKHYPRYQLAKRGAQTLEDMRYPVFSEPGKTVNIGVLEITNPAWPVFIDFLKSETAIRKSERNDSPPPVINGNATQSPNAAGLPAVNFDRVKTICCVRQDVAMAGPKALVPPYSLTVIWPTNPFTARHMYEFLSLEEFHLDLRQMMLSEIESDSLWMAVVAFLCEIPATVLGWWSRRLQRKMSNRIKATELRVPVMT